eukprot:m.65331 g.65331  ORF g.65331 m.65331 type:complete len:704 (+) comp35316_c0_seq10:6005-8116(+)
MENEEAWSDSSSEFDEELKSSEEETEEETNDLSTDEGESDEFDEELDELRAKFSPKSQEQVENQTTKPTELEENKKEEDESDEEEPLNTVGSIPMEWYNDFPHIGYDLHGEKILKPATSDELDKFLAKMEDPDWGRTVHDTYTGRDIVLTDEEVDMIRKLQTGQYPSSGYNPYEPYVEFFTNEKMAHPLSTAPEPKSRFIPSKWEHKRIIKIVRAIRNGWIQPKKKRAVTKPKYSLLWDQMDEQPTKPHPMQIPAPKMKLPGHGESYNPPPEYLPTEEETKKWESKDPEDRPAFLPQRHTSLRQVPGYSNFVQERFDRCLDLYLCARQRKMRLDIDPEELIPKLPKPRDLLPFPTSQSIVYEGHESLVRSISVSPAGQWLVSGGDDCTVRFWEVDTGRCVKTIKIDFKVYDVAWCPNSSVLLVAVACESETILINPGIGNSDLCSSTDVLISSHSNGDDDKDEEKAPSLISWTVCAGVEYHTGLRMKIHHNHIVKQVTWHGKGDYFATVMPDGGHTSVLIHQLSKRTSQNPLKKVKGKVQKVLFHPTHPHFLVATQRYIRIYNLVKQELTKKLISGVKWISSMDIHPKGDNVIIGSYDQRLCWFDLDLSGTPYKTLRHHKKAVRQVVYHRRYPLFASASDDGTVVVFHGMVYSDLMQNPLIVPVKILRGHATVDQLGVLNCVFHPSQPWIFSAGADRTIRLFT